MPTIQRLAIIGLDCADPTLVFDRWLGDLPNLRRLVERGASGRLESCMPPITVPAWACMGSGRDPGTLGIYGFRNRRDWSYDNLGIATNVDIHEPRLWDYVSRAGRPSIIVGVPPTYPIVNPPLGCMLGCFMTPSAKSGFAHPPALGEALQAKFGPYQPDVEGFRTDDKPALLRRIHDFARQRFAICRHLLDTQPWSLFWMVEMGVDRLHHGFWRYMDPRHPRHEPGHPLAGAIHDYYVMIDREIGTLLERIDLDTTAVWVVSDHGATCMEGGFCFNDWLIRRGYLTLKTPLAGPRPFKLDDVDWSRTRAWGEGGYYGRLFVNRRGREPQGIVDERDYDGLLAELARELESLVDHRGEPMGTRAYRPDAIYARVNGVPPDLVVIFGGLRWRSVGTVGNPDVYTFENDTGPDDANHAQFGLHILAAPGLAPARRDASIYDVLPTALQMLELPAVEGLRGRSLV